MFWAKAHNISGAFCPPYQKVGAIEHNTKTNTEHRSTIEDFRSVMIAPFQNRKSVFLVRKSKAGQLSFEVV